jgi:hypothetical protein
MKKKPTIIINPLLDDKYKNIKFSSEHQQKHNDLVALIDRMQTKQESQTTAFQN